MNAILKEILEIAQTWPDEDQEALAEAAREIQAHRSGVYRLTDDERAAVEEARDQARRGEIASDIEMETFWNRVSR
jgi:hypothetical protein